MLLSMTGYGKGESNALGSSMKVEIKSLNGKVPDCRLRLPTRFREKEIDIRKMILEEAQRGKMDVTIAIDGNSGDDEFDLNPGQFRRYLSELKNIAEAEGIENSDLIGAVMRFPNVIQTVDTSVSEEEWSELNTCINQALQKLQSFRQLEGQAMHEAILNHVIEIENALKNIQPLDGERMDRIKSRISGSLKDHLQADQIDENRFEQELIYYMEKLDISEEKIRLKQHCDYFREVLDSTEGVKGKKLGFISQEMGREINTLGAKAQHSEIQKLVVSMKDDLEKIKEQLANVV